VVPILLKLKDIEVSFSGNFGVSFMQTAAPLNGIIPTLPSDFSLGSVLVFP
jgi:hypothetical protein